MKVTAYIRKPVPAPDSVAIVQALVRRHEHLSVAELVKHSCEHHINSFELGLAVGTLRGRGQLKVQQDGSIYI